MIEYEKEKIIKTGTPEFQGNPVMVSGKIEKGPKSPFLFCLRVYCSMNFTDILMVFPSNSGILISGDNRITR